MFISKIEREGDDFITLIPAAEVESQGLSDGDWVEIHFSRPTEAELAEYLEKHPEEQESGS